MSASDATDWFKNNSYRTMQDKNLQAKILKIHELKSPASHWQREAPSVPPLGFYAVANGLAAGENQPDGACDLRARV
jgi:hypothetical protein